MTIAADLVEEACRRLAAAAGRDARVILFGSRARGDAGPDSDLDFLVVKPRVRDPIQEATELRRSLRGLGVPVDVLGVDSEYAQQWGAVRGTAVEAAMREGRPVGG